MNEVIKLESPTVSPRGLPPVPLFASVLAEIDRARSKFPEWPSDPLHALAVVQEEVGELQKEVLQMCYEPHKTSVEALRKEAVQATAMMFRFLASLDEYSFEAGIQHLQRVACAARDRGDGQLGHSEGCILGASFGNESALLR